MVQVCILVHSPSIGCPVAYPFTVVFSTVDGSAGKHFSVACFLNICLDSIFILRGWYRLCTFY